MTAWLSQQNTVLSRRLLLRELSCLGSAVALGGCAGIAQSASRSDSSALAIDPILLVATTRKMVNGGRAAPYFSSERAANLTIARATFTPPDYGRFSFASVGMSEWKLQEVEPLSGHVGSLLSQSRSGPDILIYVHGYRQTFEEAALDAARLSNSIKFQGKTMVFSWPSRTGLLDYAYDRESAIWSRDAFERLLASLMTDPNGRIHIVAHSMGAMLVLESLRLVYGRHGDAASDRIGTVIFASPDIDIDVFGSSIPQIGPIAPKITVIAGSNDRALALSRRVAGGVARVGAAEKKTLERLGLRVVDTSGFGWGIINHDLFMSQTEVQRMIQNAIDQSHRS